MGDSPTFDTAEYEAIRAVDKLFVFAAGNEATNTDTTRAYPASYDLPNILSVGASDRNDSKAPYSNYGTATVDVFAPGTEITSTVPVQRVFKPNVSGAVFSDAMDRWATGPKGPNQTGSLTRGRCALPSPSRQIPRRRTSGTWTTSGATWR